jgi:tetratricopeptide (TPR) repeat protein
MSQLKVFLSHSSQDKAFADAFAQALRDAGADVWYDEESLGTGHLRRTIMKELGDRPVFLVLLSKPAMASTWVLDECEWAYDLQRGDANRTILPVVAQALDWADLGMALYLRSLKRVEAGDLRPLPVAEAAAQTLRLLGLTPKGPPPPPVTPQPRESAHVLLSDATVLIDRKQHTQAISLLEKATQLEPDNSSAWFHLGVAYKGAEHWEASLAAFDRALTLQPGYLAALVGKVTVLDALGRYQEALLCVDRVIAIRNDAWSWKTKSTILRALGRDEEARKAEAQAILLDLGR